MDRKKTVITGVGMVLVAIGVSILYLGWDYVNRLCYAGGPCGGLGTTGWVAEDLRFLAASLGLLVSLFGCRFVWTGMKMTDAEHLTAGGILAQVIDPVKAAGVVTLFASFLTLVVVLTIPSSATAWCYGGCIPRTLSAIVILGALGFATGVVASVLLLSGRYHIIVAIGIGSLVLASILDLLTDIQTWGNSTSVIVSLCALAVGLVATGKKRGSSIFRTAGIFAIVAACISLLSGLLGFDSYRNPPLDFSGFIHTFGPPEFLVLGFLGTLGFGLGLVAGVFTLKRSRYSVIVTGLLIMILSPVIPFGMALLEALQFQPPCLAPLCYTEPLVGLTLVLLVFGAPTIILSSFAIIFVVRQKLDFKV